MDGSLTWASFFPILATLFGVLASTLMGMAIAKLGGIDQHLARMNGRIAEHIENKDLHYAAQAKTDEQVRNLLQTVKVAHERIDRIEAKT